MTKRKKPTGFVAVCQCNVAVGALDFKRTETKDAGKILGKWLEHGCTIHPQFGGGWAAYIENCKCDNEASK